MRVVLDTSVLVDADRRREATIRALEALTVTEQELWISTVSVAEFLVGPQLRRDRTHALERARHLLGQFRWRSFDGAVAERAGAWMAALHVSGWPVGFQDVAIGATAVEVGADALLTENPSDFSRFPELAGRVSTVAEWMRPKRKARRRRLRN